MKRNGLRMKISETIIVRGAGDIATGTIYRLYKAGFRVIALDIEAPTVIRRTVAFAQAIQDGMAVVEDVAARRCESIEEVCYCLKKGEIPVCVDPKGDMIRMVRPDAVVDAILAKRILELPGIWQKLLLLSALDLPRKRMLTP